MPTTVPAGAFGFDPTGEAISINTNGSSNYITIRTDAWLHIFRRRGVELQDYRKDALGLYTHLNVDGRGEAKFATMRPTYHLFRPRQNGCVWDPNGKIRYGLDKIYTHPIEFQGEQCPDAYWNTCFEALFPGGNAVRDLNSSPELRRLLAETINTLATGLGNSFHELISMGLHPSIEDVDTAGTFAVDEDRWNAFYNQMVGTASRPNGISGIITVLDGLADEGEPGYDIDIPDADIDANDNYTGDIEALFETMINRAKSELRLMARRGIQSGMAIRYPIILATGPEFRAYKQVLLSNGNGLDRVFEYRLANTDGTSMMLPNVLHYNGIPVVEWDESIWFDEITGQKSHRVCLVAPGTFGIASDVDNVGNYLTGGAGLRITQKLDAPYNGKIYMDTTLRAGAGLADKDFCVYARNLSPNA